MTEVAKILSKVGVQFNYVHGSKLDDALHQLVENCAELEWKPLRVLVEQARFTKSGFDIGLTISGKYSFALDVIYVHSDKETTIGVTRVGQLSNVTEGRYTKHGAFNLKSTVNDGTMNTLLLEVFKDVKRLYIK